MVIYTVEYHAGSKREWAGSPSTKMEALQNTALREKSKCVIVCSMLPFVKKTKIGIDAKSYVCIGYL